MSNIEPTIRLEQGDCFTHVNMGYTNDALNAMAQRAAEHIEDELAQQLLARLGYVKVVRCKDCRRASIGDARTDLGEPVMCRRVNWPVNPDGFCAWGKRKEVAE